MSGPLAARAAAAWNGGAPHWVLALAAACDRENQTAIAARVGYSAPVINQVIKNTYSGRLDRVEQAVQGALLKTTVECPVLSEISARECARHQRRKIDALGANPQWIRMWRACRGRLRGQTGPCAHSLIGPEPDDA